MADSKWTREQWEAITAGNGSLLVAAAAGAGKTAVLVERIIRRITDEAAPLDIDRLLVVTFTNAAAAEMRERIGSAISKALEREPGSRVLQRQLILLNKANITTIHSFCLEVIRNHFQHIDLDPGFRIADEAESLLLKMEAMDELFEELYTEDGGNSEFLELLECYGGNRDDLAIQNMVLSLYSFVQSHPWPEEWLLSRAEQFNLREGADFAATSWGKLLIENTVLELQGLRIALEKAIRTAEAAEGLGPYLPALTEDAGILEAAAAALDRCGEKSWDALVSLFSSVEFPKLARCGKDADKQAQEAVKDVREEIKKKFKSLAEDVFYASSAEVVKELRYLYPLLKCLGGLVLDFDRKYSEKKRRRQLLDFNDLEHLSLKILLTGDAEGGPAVPSPVALEYRSRFEEILVDEYQDSNLVQEILIRSISRVEDGRPNIFMVGDVKQSIYRFRQAKPELFMEKYNTYSEQAGSSFRKIKLFRNFRSRREVLDGTNYIFRQVMSEAAGELDYTEEEALNPGASYEEPQNPGIVAGGPLEVHIVETGGRQTDEPEDAGETGEPGESALPGGDEMDGLQTGELQTMDPGEERELPGAVQREAAVAVRRIRELMEPDSEGRQFMVLDSASREYRPLQYKDIVILLRSTKNWAPVYLEEFTLHGIPAFADAGEGFFRTVEVQIMLSLLQIIDNPRQDIPLLAVLRSPVAGFTADELAELRMADRTGGLYDALTALAGQGQGNAAVKAESFLKDLEHWRELSLYKSTDELLWHLYSDTGFLGYAGAMPGGARRQANLRLLFERARQFEETSYKGLFHFIRFIDKLKSGKGDMGSAKILGENENVVRIMSIHKSKGLEFPVVILAGCGKRFNLQDLNRSILFHQELGYGPDVVDYRRRVRRISAAKQALRCKIRKESLSEEMRILYVAMTRAKEKLIITGSVSNAGKAGAGWSRSADGKEAKLPGVEVLKGRCYFDWMLPALLRHRGCEDLTELLHAASPAVLVEDASRWVFRLWNGNERLDGETAEEEKENTFLQKLSALEEDRPYGGSWEEINRRLGWEYPYASLSAIPAKLSVTEMKRRFAAEFAEETAVDARPAPVRKPAFLEEMRGLDAAEAGTALHFVMQHLRLEAVSDREEIRRQTEEMAARGMLTPKQAEAVDTGKVLRFFESPLGRRMLASSAVRRELPFNLEVPGSEVVQGINEACRHDTVLLQGVIDCCFEEPGGLVLIDYKTDYAPEEKIAELKERYRMQISYYTRALEQLTGRKVKESSVYLFWSGRTIGY